MVSNRGDHRLRHVGYKHGLWPGPTESVHQDNSALVSMENLANPKLLNGSVYKTEVNKQKRCRMSATLEDIILLKNRVGLDLK